LQEDGIVPGCRGKAAAAREIALIAQGIVGVDAGKVGGVRQDMMGAVFTV